MLTMSSEHYKLHSLIICAFDLGYFLNNIIVNLSRKYPDFVFYFISFDLFTLIMLICVYFLPLYIIYHIYDT